jgi:hypothetical protein
MADNEPREASGDEFKIILVTAIIAFLVATALGAGLYQLVLRPALVAVSDGAEAEAEYYRGLYDVCFWETGDPVVCNGFAGRAMAAGWYESPSDGYDWEAVLLAAEGDSG